MVHEKKLARVTLLPSVLEDDDAETQSEALQLGEVGSRPSSQAGKLWSEVRCETTSEYAICLEIKGAKGSEAASKGGEREEYILEEMTLNGPSTLMDSKSAEVSKTGVDVRGPKDQRSNPEGNVRDGGGREDEEEAEEEEENEQEERGGEQRASSDEDYDTDLELGDKEEVYDPGQRRYMEACEALQVVPASSFLRQMKSSELSMMHRSLGPQGTKALAVPLVTNTSILRLNLRDNWMEGMGGAAIAEMLKENCYITEVDLSENKLGDDGARAIAGMLKENSTLLKLNLSGNHFTDLSAEYLSPALISNTRLQHLDLSHNTLGERAGQHLGDSLSENMGLRSLSLAWNSFRGRGAVMLANGLGGNIFIRRVDLSFNGFGKEGAAALGQALKDNSVLEELNVSNNRIPPEGAVRLAMGLKANKTIKSLNMGRNPILTAGCYGILKSVQENPESAMEALDFSDITVNQDFEDLYVAVKEILPALAVNHGGRIGTFRKASA